MITVFNLKDICADAFAKAAVCYLRTKEQEVDPVTQFKELMGKTPPNFAQLWEEILEGDLTNLGQEVDKDKLGELVVALESSSERTKDTIAHCVYPAAEARFKELMGISAPGTKPSNIQAQEPELLDILPLRI